MTTWCVLPVMYDIQYVNRGVEGGVVCFRRGI